MKLLENKVAIVTGAASGIGKATALLLAQEGAKVVVSDIAEDQGAKVAQEIENNGGEALFVKTNTSKSNNHEELVNTTLDKFGKLDIAVNNAGIGGPLEPVGEYPVDEWDDVIGINL